MSRDDKNKQPLLRSILNLSNVTGNIAYFLFLTGIAMTYIWNSHYAEKTRRKINTTKKEIKGLRWNYVSAKSELMHRSKQSEVSKIVEPFGLKELTVPPKKIVVPHEQ